MACYCKTSFLKFKMYAYITIRMNAVFNFPSLLDIKVGYMVHCTVNLSRCIFTVGALTQLFNTCNGVSSTVTYLTLLPKHGTL